MFSETIARFLTHHLGQAAYFGFVAALLVAIPFVLIWLVAGPLIRERECGSRYGLVVGFAMAIWASVCELCVPHLGLYPNLPGVAFALLVGADAAWVAEVCIHGTNAVLWPLLGWLGFRFREKLRTSRAEHLTETDHPLPEAS